ncbi:general glycosylation pathway protein [Candidatus Electrothrix sp.]|uniref:general glycosylation pathway protein n=1 Tax=Candidatus Electrothrix sp. TaxID=2170559 RepID=UPI004057C762
MSKLKLLPSKIGQVMFALISLFLSLISLAMITFAIINIHTSINDKTLFTKALLDAVGFIVIGMAVFDVSKFLLEEEVIKSHEEITPATEKAMLSKFLVIIAIAVSLEALVFIFNAGKEDIALLIYPAFLLVTVSLLIISLGLYHKMT